MRRQSIIALVAAALFGLLAVYLVNVYLSGAEREARPQIVQTTRIAVARVPLDFGARITPQNVQFVDWPVNSVPQGAYRDIAELMPAGQTHVVLRPLVPGEPVLRNKLSGEGGRATLSALLPPEMRATSIRVSDVAGVAGFVLPGDRVDILLTRAQGEGDSSTEVLLANVRVIAIDQLASESQEQPVLARTATLELSPEDAQKVVLAGTVGTLSLVLRSVRAPQEGITYANVMRASDFAGGVYTPAATQVAQAAPAAGGPPQVVRRARPRGPTVEIIRGTTSREHEVRPFQG